MTSKQGNSFVSQSLSQNSIKHHQNISQLTYPKPTQQTHPEPLIPHFFICWPCGKADMSKNSMAARNLAIEITGLHSTICWLFSPQDCWWFRNPCKPPWEPKTFIFGGYNPCFGGVTPAFFMVLGSKGSWSGKYPHYLQAFIRPRWWRISEPSTVGSMVLVYFPAISDLP